MKQPSFPAEMERVIDDLVKSAADDIEWMLDSVLMPDGRPFRAEKMSEKEQLVAYVESGLRDDPEKTKEFVRTAVERISEFLIQMGNSPAEIAAAHPYNVAQYVLVSHVAKMERLYREHVTKISHAVTAPTISSEMDDEPWPIQIT